MRQFRFLVFIPVFLLIQYTGLTAQTIVSINNISPNDQTKTLDVEINALHEGRRLELDASRVLVYETRDGVTFDTMHIDIVEPIRERVTEEMHVLFLIDLSQSMQGARLEATRQAINRLIMQTNLPEETTYISTFDNDVSHNRILNKENVQAITSSFEAVHRGRDLYRALKVKTEELRLEEGKRVIILVTDGKNDISRNPIYQGSDGIMPISEAEIMSMVSELDSQFHIFSVGVGTDVDMALLNNIKEATPSKVDDSRFAPQPVNIEEHLMYIVQGLTSNYIFKLVPGNPIYSGEQRQLFVELLTGHEARGEKMYGFGSSTNPRDLRRVEPPRSTDWLFDFLGGILSITGLFVLFSLGVPIYKDYLFRKEYVHPYGKIKKAGVTKRDPVTGDAFDDHENVVNKCEHMISYASWKYNRNKCVYYPDDCTDGVANVDTEQFFSQQGLYKNLNWIWFGTMGGLLAWTSWAILSNIQQLYITLDQMIFKTLTTENMAKLLNDFGIYTDVTSNTMTLVQDTVTGVAMGAGLAFALCWVDERGQSYKLSWGRIFMKTILGAVASGLVFLIGFVINYAFFRHAFFQGLATWIFFGLLLGFIVSVASGISTKRALVGGILASTAGYLTYYSVSLWYPNQPTVRMFSYILMGGLMGIVMVSVVTRAEDFELEYIAPQKFRRVNPISKWLKSGIEIYIGTDSSNYVFVKWTDPAVQPKHAKLSYKGGQVFITPYAETLVNGNVIKQGDPHLLNNGDVIQPGRQSATKMLYREKYAGEIQHHSPSAAMPAGPAARSPRTNPGSEASIKIKSRRAGTGRPPQ